MEFSSSRSTYVDLAGGDREVHAFLGDEAFLNAIVEFEAALANVAGELGIVEPEVCEEALRTISGYEPDVESISRASAAGANPAIPIAKELKALAPAAQAAIHTGATSQDAIDTALSLCLKRGGESLLSSVQTLSDIVHSLAVSHSSTPMIGRTLGQQANPSTLGLIAAGWWECLDMAADDLRCAVNVLPVQYAGATGTLAATYPHGIAIHDKLAESLGLAARPVVWHTNRVPFVRLAAALAEVAGAVRKIAGDVVFLSANEVDELREAQPGGSSSMPHKSNPAAAVAADGYARRTPGLASTIFDAMDSRLQRGVGSWHAEWQTLRELMAATASAVARTRASLDGIRVNTASMAAHLNDTATAGHAEEIVDLILGGR